MKILFIGPTWYGSNALSLANGFAAEGNEVRTLDTTPLARPKPLEPLWISRRANDFLLPSYNSHVRRKIHNALTSWKPDAMVCFKTIHLDQEMLLNLPIGLKVHYSPDDVANPTNLSKQYLDLERGWSLIVTTKSHNVSEIERRSGAKTLMVWSAFDPSWHHPVAPALSAEKFQVGFIGNGRADRADLMAQLANHLGKSMYLSGERWLRLLGARTSSRLSLHRANYGERFSAAVAHIGVNLVLLNSDNRDQHTCRSFEVPAAGGLVLAERTAEHQAILEEGSEALMFSSRDEMLGAIDHVATHPREARRMAIAGRARIVGEGHTYRDRARQILDHLA